MAKFIILFFLITGSGVSYLTYTGVGQDSVETIEKETVRSNSYRSSRSSWGGSSSSYNSSGYSYGK